MKPEQKRGSITYRAQKLNLFLIRTLRHPSRASTVKNLGKTEMVCLVLDLRVS